MKCATADDPPPATHYLNVRARYAANKKAAENLDKLEIIVDLLQANLPLPPRCKVHPLRGEWEGHWDCHVEPDWLLLYKITPDDLILVRTGSHSELFGG
ncbi:MAG: type II toxin-antitoxin system YafQ family toxin [Bryobacteraceae bacterium]